MTKKHKIRKSKHLLENKKGVDENVESILRMIGDENQQAENEQDDSENSLKRSKLSSLVKGFHEDYEHLHKHFKQLVSKLENVGHSSSGSDSSDSDVEGDSSDNDDTMPKVTTNEENGWKNKLVEDHNVEAEIEELKQNAEEQAKEIFDLKQLLDNTIKDKDTTTVEFSSEIANLSSENENLKSLIEIAEREKEESLKALKSMEDEIKTLSSEKQTSEREQDNLKQAIVEMEKEKEDLNNQLKDTVHKCAVLSSELEKAQLAEKEVQTLLAENQKLKNDNLMLLAEYENLKTNQQNLDIECSQLKATVAESKAENESLIDQKHSVESKLQHLGVEIDGLKVEKAELMDTLDMERRTAAEEKERLGSEHSMCLNELDKAQSSVKELKEELESTKSVLNGNIAELQKENNSATSQIKQLEASLENLENELERQLERISDMQKTKEGLELANSNLQNEIVEVQRQKNEADASIINLESKLERQTQEISDLQEANKDLKAAKTDLYNEITAHEKEKNAILTQLQQTEAYLSNLQSELAQQRDQISVFQQANEELQEKNRQLEQSKSNLQEKIMALQGEKEEALNNLQHSNASIKTLEVQLEQQRELISVLQLASEDLQNINSNLRMQLEEAKVSHDAEILALQDENNKVLSEFQQAEASIKSLITELEQGKEQISILNLATEDMKNNNVSLGKELEEIRSSLHAEIAALCGEKDIALSELQTSQASVRNLESALEKQSGNISSLQQANDDLQKNICILTEKLEQTKSELQSEVKATQEEKDTALTQLKQSETSVKNLENEVAQLKEELSVQLDNNSTLDKQLQETILSVSDLHEKFEKAQNEAASQTNNMSTKTKDLEMTIDLLSSEKTKVEEDLYNEIKAHEEEKNAILAQLQQTEVYLSNLQSELAQQRDQISVFQQANEELQEKNRQLEESKTNLQGEIMALQGEKEEALNNLQQSNASIKTLEVQLEQQREVISVLQLASDDLQKSNSNLRMQLEEAKISHGAEIFALQDENNKVLSELQQAEASIKSLIIELEQGKEQISILNLANEDMKNNSASLGKELEEIRSSLHAEIAALCGEKDTALSELQMSQVSVRNFESALEKQRENISTLQQANDDLQKNICILTEKLEQTKSELQNEVKATQEEKDTALTQLKQSETSVKNLENEVARLKEELSVQLENNSTLDKQLQEAILSVSNLHEKFEKAQNEAASQINDMKNNSASLGKELEEIRSSLHAEIAALCGEKDTALSELQMSQASVRNLESALEEQSGNISNLQQANDDLQKNICILTEKLEQTKSELQDEVKATQEEKDTALTQLKQSETSVKNLENEVARLKDELSVQLENNSTLDKQLQETILSVSNLHEKFEKAQNEAASQINDMSTKTKDLEMTIDLLSSEKTKVEDHLKIMIEACTENMLFMGEFEDRVKQKITDKETGLAVLQQSLRGVLSSCQRLHSAYDEVSTKASQLEVLTGNQLEQIDQLEEKNKESLDKCRLLEEDKLYANKENSKLQKHVQDLEVQLQLAKQKLKVTEAESRHKEDSYTKAAETSQAGIRNLEEQIQQFSGRIISLEETLMQIKENAESGVTKLADQMDELESVFNQSFTRFLARSSTCSEDLKLLWSKLHDQLGEQKELVKKNDNLSIRLREKENVMTEMAKSAAQAEAKMIQLEKAVQEKEEELAARVQEKREAIKQLSDAIVYHKNNSDDLVRYIRSRNRPRLPFCL